MDDNMKKALAWIESRKTIRSCDCCGQNSWTFGEDIVTTPILSGGGMVIGGKSSTRDDTVQVFYVDDLREDQDHQSHLQDYRSCQAFP